MAITLGGISLPDLTMDQEFAWTGVEAAVDMTVGGAPVVWERSISGRPLDLVGGDDTGWITRTVLGNLYDLASVPRASYTLSYEGTDYTVRFRHEDGAIEAAPVIPRPNHAGTDYYRNVRIRLMVI